MTDKITIALVTEVPAGEFCWDHRIPDFPICEHFDNEHRRDYCELFRIDLTATANGYLKCAGCREAPNFGTRQEARHK